MTTPRGSLAGSDQSSARRALVAACLGNAVEWYDFAIFGALATVVVPVFFPAAAAGSGLLLAAFAVYGTAFLARPLGALLIGRRGDSHGRRTVLVALILGMTGATTAVGLLPDFAAIGLAAPVAVVALRAAQGLAAGGELGVAAAFLTEHAPDRRRGEFAGWHTATLALGLAAGLGVGGLLALLPSTTLAAGWWRVAFLLALPLGMVGVYMRRRVPETPHFAQLPDEQGGDGLGLAPLRRSHGAALRTGFTVIAAGSLTFNTFFVYLPNHLVVTTNRSLSTALLAAIAGLAAAATAALALGRLSDRIGRQPVVRGSVIGIAIVTVPLIAAACTGSFLALVTASVVAGVLVGGTLSVSMLAEMFPTRVRASGLSMTAGLAAALVGGTGPFVDQVLFNITDLHIAPALYVVTLAAAALVSLWGRPETAFDGLS